MSKVFDSCVEVMLRRSSVEGRAAADKRAILHFPRVLNSMRLNDQKGFTLIEILVTISLITVLLAMSVGAMSYYLAGRSLDSGAREVATQVREAQQMAVTTGNTYRVDFSNGSHTVYQLQARQGGGWSNVHGEQRLPSGVVFSTSSPPSFGGDSYIDCYSRGACESGTLVLEGGFGKSTTISVDGETANVRIG